jgi:hypothetical protein
MQAQSLLSFEPLHFLLKLVLLTSAYSAYPMH